MVNESAGLTNFDLKRISESEFLLGDSAEVLKGYRSDQAHLVVTSPPYFNQREEYATYKTLEEYLSQMTKIFVECARILKPGRIFVVNIGQDTSVDLPAMMSMLLRDIGLDYVDKICWNKGGEIGERGIHMDNFKYYPNYAWEEILVYRRPPKDLGAGVVSGDNFPEFDPIDVPYITSTLRSNVWKVQPQKGSWHPAPYPQELVENIIRCYTKQDEIVIDPFGGSGTTAKAALARNRRYILVERMKEYYDKACNEIASAPLSLML